MYAAGRVNIALAFGWAEAFALKDHRSESVSDDAARLSARLQSLAVLSIDAVSTEVPSPESIHDHSYNND